MDCDGTEIVMREPCRWCGFVGSGVVHYRGGQYTVRCGECNRHVYNAPKTELGLRPVTVQTIRDISPADRVYVLFRAAGHCEVPGCGKTFGTEVVPHLAHLVSVNDILRLKLPLQEAKRLANCLENLAALCDECNLGLGKASVNARTLMAIAVKTEESRKEERRL